MVPAAAVPFGADPGSTLVAAMDARVENSGGTRVPDPEELAIVQRRAQAPRV